MACAAAGSEQVVARPTKEEWATPIRVSARIGDIFAGDPDGVAVHGSRSVVSPARARGVPHFGLIAGETIVLGSTCSAVDDVPRTNANDGVNRCEAGARAQSITSGREADDSASAWRDPNSRIGEIVTRRSEVALQH